MMIPNPIRLTRIVRKMIRSGRDTIVLTFYTMGSHAGVRLRACRAVTCYLLLVSCYLLLVSCYLLPDSDVGPNGFMGPLPTVLDRRQHDVGGDRRAPERILANRIRDRIQNRSVTGADRRLADAAGADR